MWGGGLSCVVQWVDRQGAPRFRDRACVSRVLSWVPSETCAGRLCRGRGRRSPSKSETEPRKALNREPLPKNTPVLPSWPSADYSIDFVLKSLYSNVFESKGVLKGFIL